MWLQLDLMNMAYEIEIAEISSMLFRVGYNIAKGILPFDRFDNYDSIR